jgi:hypothetical protein
MSAARPAERALGIHVARDGVEDHLPVPPPQHKGISEPWCSMLKQEGAGKRVVAVLNTLVSHPERALEAGAPTRSGPKRWRRRVSRTW